SPVDRRKNSSSELLLYWTILARRSNRYWAPPHAACVEVEPLRRCLAIVKATTAPMWPADLLGGGRWPSELYFDRERQFERLHENLHRHLGGDFFVVLRG